MSQSVQSQKKSPFSTFSYSFKQQILKAWQPVPTIASTLCVFITLGLFFVGFGIALIILSNQVIDLELRYDDHCTSGGTLTNPCEINLVISENMTAPIYFYYGLTNFYQNHRKYLKSRDAEQLAGVIKTANELSNCEPIIYNKDVASTLQNYKKTVTLNPDDVANPCGLVAKSFFTGGDQIDIDQTGIAWQSDIDNKFKKPENADNLQWIDVTNEHFIVWMRTAATPNFKKLWGKISDDLPAGTYTIKIDNSIFFRILLKKAYDVADFEGTKSIYLSTANLFGGRNNFLSIAYLSLGGICLLLAIIFFIKNLVTPKKNLPKFD